MKTASALGNFHALHPVSAKTGDGIDELRGDLSRCSPTGRSTTPPSEVTDMPLEVRIAELVREQALRLTKEEVPHALTAEVVEIDETPRPRPPLHRDREPEADPDRQGRLDGARDRPRGAARDRAAARAHVFLELQVKAAPKWRRNETMLERLGM